MQSVRLSVGAGSQADAKTGVGVVAESRVGAGANQASGEEQ